MSAFTMLEILVALVLMDLIALSLYSSLYITTKAKRGATEAIRPYALIENVYDSLRQDLQAAMMPNGILAGGFYGQDLSAAEGRQADMLQFCSASYAPSQNEKSSNIIQTAYELTLDKEVQENVLVRKTTVNLLSSKTVDISKDEVIGRRIQSLNLRYFDGYAWLDTWDSAAMDNQLPLAVEVTLTLDIENEQPQGRKIPDVKKEFTSRRVFLLSCAESAVTESAVQ
ncbi:MAG: GspJ family type II secretion system protein [Planctomycetaceae bacterium]|nr:GspJ family type II secretion system protein [Planctomycetaceae bacterium]